MNSAEFVKKAIKDSGVTLTFLSKKTGISVDSLSRTVNGKRRLLADELVKICLVLNINPLHPDKSTSIDKKK